MAQDLGWLRSRTKWQKGMADERVINPRQAGSRDKRGEPETRTLPGHPPVTHLRTGPPNSSVDESIDKHGTLMIQSPNTHVKVLEDILELNLNSVHS